MGCLDCLNPIPPEVMNAIETIITKAGEISNTAITEKSNIDNKKSEILKEREEKVQSTDKSNLEEVLKEYNKKELEFELDYIANEADKMHQIYCIGLEVADPAKKATIKMLEEKIQGANSLIKTGLQTKLNELKLYTPKQFLDSMYGKPLLQALEKQGLSQQLLDNFKKELDDDRTKRRQEERTKFGIEKNEFPPDDTLNMDSKAVYEAILDEYKGKSVPFPEYVRKKILA